MHICLYCEKAFRGGGINRVKQHLVGKTGDSLSCKKVYANTQFRMEQNLKEIEAKRKKGSEKWDDEHPYGPSVMQFNGDNLQEMPPPQSTEAAANADVPCSSQNAKK